MSRKFSKWIADNVFVIGAFLCFALAVGLVLYDRVAAAALMAGLFVVNVLFNYLPHMESFKAFGVEAKMWETKKKEAEELIKRLNNISSAIAKPTYITLASLGRWSSPLSPEEQQSMVDQLDGILMQAGHSEDAIEDLKRPIHAINIADIFNRCRQKISQAIAVVSEDNKEPLKNLNASFGGPSGESRQDAIVLAETVKNAIENSVLPDVNKRNLLADIQSGYCQLV